MLHPQCFTAQWLKQKAEAIGSRNSGMVEKAVVALQLIGHLAESSLPIQFKGGTSLLLIVSPIRRLSIDADIVTQASPGEFDHILMEDIYWRTLAKVEAWLAAPTIGRWLTPTPKEPVVPTPA